MDTTTGTLADFLLARIAEDEADFQALQDAGRRNMGKIASLVDAASVFATLDDPQIQEVLSRRTASGVSLPNDPGRVSAECAAKRQIVKEHQPESAGTPYEAYRCRTCVNPEGRDGYPDEWTAQEWPCRTLRALAEPYATHPDFRPEWRL